MVLLHESSWSKSSLNGPMSFQPHTANHILKWRVMLFFFHLVSSNLQTHRLRWLLTRVSHMSRVPLIKCQEHDTSVGSKVTNTHRHLNSYIYRYMTNRQCGTWHLLNWLYSSQVGKQIIQCFNFHSWWKLCQTIDLHKKWPSNIIGWGPPLGQQQSIFSQSEDCILWSSLMP